ncbi:amidohydrolase family protein [Nonomuraea soli]|uniref:L-fuconolactonase n=1 Tax=Nonomuraea soli TaxID=1032476 RepID=A0A7W0CQX9_9ACTN|nr:amidohydrolase family protein [Nonomuraea soli]MBA2895662.1 L-fuconolactonase [Nonomuraea soli]
MIVDAHQHFWNLETGSYPWLTPELGVLHRTYAPADLLPHLEAAGVERTVLVQAADSLDDTEAMLALAAEHDFIAGVVGWLPLMDLGDTLERYGDRLKGVRHLIHDEPDPDWLGRQPVLESLGRLAEAGLSFDVVSDLPRHLEHVETIAARYPELRLVIDHLSKPDVRAGEWEPWAGNLARVARFPNVHVKVSGLVTEADHENWTVEDLRPYVEYALELFGPERLMCGSDWPVALLAADYETVWTVHSALLAGTDRDKVLGGTAVEFYRL